MTEETIFLAALKQSSSAERAAYLDTACAGDAALRARVDALLRTHAHAHAGPDGPAIDRSAEENTEPNRITEILAGDADDSVAGSLVDEELLAFLEPSTEPGSLGRLDHFEILKVVGKGGMGVVFKARDTRLQCIVAIKVLAAQLAASGAARQRFFREARAFAAVRDEHVVSIHAVSDDTRPVPYLVMEYIAGVSLEKRIKKHGPLAVKEVLRIGMQAAAGLAAAHKQGLIHRDIKPANILLENGVERVKITDFGLARAADDMSLSQSGMLAGTPPYMSPEQARSEPLDRRSDLFSLGSVLYTLCTGEPAFWAESVVGALKRVCEDTPRPIRELNPDIPEWLEEIVNKLLSKDPAERLQSADELKGILQRRLAELQDPRLLPGSATSETWLPPAVVAPAPAPPTVSLSRKTWGRRWRRVAAGVLLLVVLVSAVAVGVAIVGNRWRQPSPSGSADASGIPAPPPRPDDPRVLTVSKRPSDKARFNTIGAALDAADEGMTIRVLDDAVYNEHLLVGAGRRGITLEGIANATLRCLPGKTDTLVIHDAPHVTVRGLRFTTSDPPDHKTYGDLIHIAGQCAGLLLDRLDMVGDGKPTHFLFIDLYWGATGTKDAPIRIQGCTFRDLGQNAIQVEGRARNNLDRPFPCGYLIIRNNVFLRCAGVAVQGATHHVLVAANRFLEMDPEAIGVTAPLPGMAEAVFVNNTMLRNSDRALAVWQNQEKYQVFGQCKNIRFQNNLILQHAKKYDMLLFKYTPPDDEKVTPGDVKSLLTSPEWHFGFNWHEASRPDPNSPDLGNAIPPVAEEHYEPVIKVLSRNPDDPNFLRPPQNSPLATGGAGAKPGPNDSPLPAYVGAVPPEGVEPWDWDKTWKALVGKRVDDPKVITVSKNPADGARFNTIGAALGEAEEGMAIRVLDSAVYDEFLRITARHRGVTLEAVGNATLRGLPDYDGIVGVQDASNFVLRGFRFVSSDRQVHEGNDQIHLAGHCPGIVLDRLTMTGNKKTDCIDLYQNAAGTKDAPIVIQNCLMREARHAINIVGSVLEDPDRPWPCGEVVIRNNMIARGTEGITVQGAVHHVLVAGNCIQETGAAAVELWDLLRGTAAIFIVNNTVFRNFHRGLHITDDHGKGKAFLKCENIRWQNNLVVEHGYAIDLLLNDHKRGPGGTFNPGDMKSLLESRKWHFSHNWRELRPPDPDSPLRAFWIPAGPDDHLQVPIDVLSRKPGDPNFLRPAKGSPLASAGAGGRKSTASDPPLPAYVGAVPPEGAEPWDWDKTWKAMVR